jgi:hypothetical protein
MDRRILAMRAKVTVQAISDNQNEFFFFMCTASMRREGLEGGCLVLRYCLKK